jgi:uracil-DNA glycosylase
MVLQCRSTLKSQTCLVATTFVIVLGRTLQKNMICIKEEIEKLFGHVVNKNMHHYTKCLDFELIAKVERLWMIEH